MKAAYAAATDLYVDEAGKNPAFKKIYVEYDKYRRTQSAWFSLAERRMDGFLQTGK
jgi:TRAP-type mannitol/chloroaromatic compound transport system substrate-binding protein